MAGRLDTVEVTGSIPVGPTIFLKHLGRIWPFARSGAPHGCARFVPSVVQSGHRIPLRGFTDMGISLKHVHGLVAGERT